MPKLKPETILPTPEEDAAINAGIKSDPDNHEWSDEDFRNAKPASQVLPPAIYSALVAKRSRGRPKSEETKIFTAIRLDVDVLKTFKSGGKGWQTRINEALQEQLSITTCLDAQSEVYARFPAPSEEVNASTSDDALEIILSNLKNQGTISIYPVASSQLTVKGRIPLGNGHSMWIFRAAKRIRPASKREVTTDRRNILHALESKGLNCAWVD